MNSVQFHRGPDESSVQVGPNWALGHTRLEVVGLGPAGSQPLWSRSGQWGVVFNGEIYNHEQLRREHLLTGLGPSDGAVIPELLERYGVGALATLRGMYSIIAVDRRSGSFLVAVDPLGIKPLSWHSHNGRVLIASEPKAFRACGVELIPDRMAISDFLSRGSIRSSSSGYLDVQRLSPGEWCLFSPDGEVTCGTTPYLKHQSANGDWVSARSAFANAVDSHTLSDVPIGLLLSDGVDSTALAYEMSLLEIDFVSLTVDLSSGRDESAGARATSDMLGMSLIEVREELDAGDVAGFFASMQRPTCDGLNNYLVTKAVSKQGLKVAVSGLGGDEVLCGYPYHRRFRWARWLSALPHELASRILSASSPGLTVRDAKERLGSASRGRLPNTPDEAVQLARQLRSQDEIRRLADGRLSSPSSLTLTSNGRGLANRFSEAEINRYLSEVLLPDADAFSMAHSVELRVPFLDPFFATAVFSIPRRRLGKRDFVRAIDAESVSTAYSRPKQGFTLPISRWLRSGALHEPLMLAMNWDAPWRDAAPETVLGELPVGSPNGPILDQLLNPGSWRSTWSIVVLDQWLRSL